MIGNWAINSNAMYDKGIKKLVETQTSVIWAKHLLGKS